MFLTSCGAIEQVQPENKVNKTVESSGTQGQLNPIHSDIVRSADYDSSLMVMTVQFNNGYTFANHDLKAIYLDAIDMWEFANYEDLGD